MNTRSFIRIIFLVLFTMVGLPMVHSQSFMSNAEFHAQLGEYPASLGADSAPRPVQRKLLPDNLSIVERGLWGENGFLRTIGIASPLTPESRKSELKLRRTMLTLHQIGGFVTLGLMLGAVYYGQQILNGQNGYRRAHQGFVEATIISYSTTGLLAILSPPPLIRRNDWGTTTIHKTLAWIHVAGMIITPILGGMINRRGTPEAYLRSEHFHQISAYITTGVFAASLIVITI